MENSALLNHLCKFIRVRNEEGKVLYFRFYDPRVLAKFLPTCTTKELTNFFGKIENFIIETENKEIASCFSLSNSNLQEDKISLV